jgi:hypothetical protein
MKRIGFFLYAILLSAVFCASGFAQKDKVVTPLAADATLADTQAWLVKVIGKNSTFHMGGAKKSISDLKFDGTKFTYTMYSEQVPGDSPEDATPQGSDSNAREESGAQSSATVFKFDLKDIDPDNVLLKPVPNIKTKMSAIILQSMPGQNSIGLTTPFKKSATLATKPTASIIVKENVAEQVKAALENSPAREVSFSDR